MFCASLRKRAAFSPILPALISDPRFPLRESILTTHDLTIPLKDSSSIATPDNECLRNVRVLLLSRADVEDQHLPNTMQRIEHFVYLTGGRDLGIFFLISTAPLGKDFQPLMKPRPVNNPDEALGVIAFSKLQTTIMNHVNLPNVQVVPVEKLEQLPNLLHMYAQRLLANPPSYLGRPLTSNAFDLLQICTTNPPMSQQSAYVLSDMYPNLNQLAEASTSTMSDFNYSSPSEGAGSSELGGYGKGKRFKALTKTEVKKYSSRQTARNLLGGNESTFLSDFWKKDRIME